MGAVALCPKLGKPFRQDSEGTTAGSAIRASTVVVRACPTKPATNVAVDLSAARLWLRGDPPKLS